MTVHRPVPGDGRPVDVPGSLGEAVAAWKDHPGPAFASERRAGSATLEGYDLWDRCTRTAGGLLGRTAPGSPVLVACVDPLDFVVAFLGTALAGHVAVPLSPRLEHPRHALRFGAIAAAHPDAVVLTSEAQRATVAGAHPERGRSAHLLTIESLAAHEQRVDLATTPEATHYLQYTSGSTRTPRAVRVTTDAVRHHVRQAATTYGETQGSVAVNWVPLYHDMGLVVALLRPLMNRYTSVLLDPFEFVSDPVTWPVAMSTWRASHTSSPDFGYALTASRSDGDPRIAALDLSHLEVARTAGELVRPETVSEFVRVFAPQGLDPSAIAPSYGLAEATLTVTSSSGPVRVLDLDARLLREGRAAVVDDADEGGRVRVVSCGPPVVGTSVVVVSETSRAPVEDGRVGELWASGPQVVAEPTLTLNGEHGYLTGDLGFRREGEIYLLGRSAERFQVRGENYYSTELEGLVLLACPELRRGRTAVFHVPDGTGPSTGTCVVAEWARSAEPTEDALASTGREIVRVLATAGLRTDHVRIVPAGTIPLTTSGKVRRSHCEPLLSTHRLWSYDRASTRPAPRGRELSPRPTNDPSHVERNTP